MDLHPGLTDATRSRAPGGVPGRPLAIALGAVTVGAIGIAGSMPVVGWLAAGYIAGFSLSGSV